MSRGRRRHLRRWGAVYVLLLLFVGSWAGQWLAQLAQFRREAAAHGEDFDWSEFRIAFLASTFENWQSEWLQLLVQAILLLALKHVLFRADAEDMDRVQAKLDQLLAAQGLDAAAAEAEVARKQEA